MNTRNGYAPLEYLQSNWVEVRPATAGQPALRLHVRRWPGDEQPYVLLHGLSSNAQTWNVVAQLLAKEGHAVYAVDQRGHGLSDKPADGYDFATVSEDLALLCDRLELDYPIIAGQSWGGNVVLAFGAAYPKRAAELVFVDGGFLDFQSRPEMTWERVSVELRPPALTGMQRSELAERIQAMNPEWTSEGVEATLANFEVLRDGTVRPWLSLDRHMAILRALWEQHPAQLYPKVNTRVLIVAADDAGNPEWMAVKRAQVDAAVQLLPSARAYWFPKTAHDIHVHRPSELAGIMLDWREDK